MRPTLLLALVTSFATGCLGEVGGPRQTGSGSGSNETAKPTADGPCTKIEKDVTIRAIADMSLLPRTDCYDIIGKLTIQGPSITTLLALEQLNSVSELDLDHTGLTKIDSKRAIGIYGRLTVTGNASLANLKQLQFETASTGILIDNNTALASLDPIALTTPRLDEVDGDVTITGNPALTAVAFPNLTKVTGKLLVSGNASVTSVDLSKLAITGGVEIADSPRLTALTGLAATNINGDLAIRNNAALTSLGTMASLYRLTGNLTIDNNPALTNLASLTTSVKLIDRGLTITNNQNLTDLGALKHLQLVSAITITHNQNLVTCRALEIDRCTGHPSGVTTINSNRDTSCNTSCN